MIRLTPTETEVMDLLAQGNRATDIALHLGKPKRTIDFHLGNIYRKMEVPNNVQAILKWKEVAKA